MELRHLRYFIGVAEEENVSRAASTIAHELVETIRNRVTIDLTEREAVRARISVAVKRILRKHGYPPDKQEKATQTLLQQAECSARIGPNAEPSFNSSPGSNHR